METTEHLASQSQTVSELLHTLAAAVANMCSCMPAALLRELSGAIIEAAAFAMRAMMPWAAFLCRLQHTTHILAALATIACAEGGGAVLQSPIVRALFERVALNLAVAIDQDNAAVTSERISSSEILQPATCEPQILADVLWAFGSMGLHAAPIAEFGLAMCEEFVDWWVALARQNSLRLGRLLWGLLAVSGHTGGALLVLQAAGRRACEALPTMAGGGGSRGNKRSLIRPDDMVTLMWVLSALGVLNGEALAHSLAAAATNMVDRDDDGTDTNGAATRDGNSTTVCGTWEFSLLWELLVLTGSTRGTCYGQELPRTWFSVAPRAWERVRSVASIGREYSGDVWIMLQQALTQLGVPFELNVEISAPCADRGLVVDAVLFNSTSGCDSYGTTGAAQRWCIEIVSDVEIPPPSGKTGVGAREAWSPLVHHYGRSQAKRLHLSSTGWRVIDIWASVLKQGPAGAAFALGQVLSTAGVVAPPVPPTTDPVTCLKTPPKTYPSPVSSGEDDKKQEETCQAEGMLTEAAIADLELKALQRVEDLVKAKIFDIRNKPPQATSESKAQPDSNDQPDAEDIVISELVKANNALPQVTTPISPSAQGSANGTRPQEPATHELCEVPSSSSLHAKSQEQAILDLVEPEDHVATSHGALQELHNSLDKSTVTPAVSVKPDSAESHHSSVLETGRGDDAGIEGKAEISVPSKEGHVAAALVPSNVQCNGKANACCFPNPCASLPTKMLVLELRNAGCQKRVRLDGACITVSDIVTVYGTVVPGTPENEPPIAIDAVGTKCPGNLLLSDLIDVGNSSTSNEMPIVRLTLEHSLPNSG